MGGRNVEQYNLAGGEKGSIWCSAWLCLVAQPCPALEEQPKRRHGNIDTLNAGETLA